MRLVKTERTGFRRRAQSLGEIVALAYPDRIAQARGDAVGQFRLTSGRGAFLPPTAIRWRRALPRGRGPRRRRPLGAHLPRRADRSRGDRGAVRRPRSSTRKIVRDAARERHRHARAPPRRARPRAQADRRADPQALARAMARRHPPTRTRGAALDATHAPCGRASPFCVGSIPRAGRTLSDAALLAEPSRLAGPASWTASRGASISRASIVAAALLDRLVLETAARPRSIGADPYRSADGTRA